jgi:hypothetical protein
MVRDRFGVSTGPKYSLGSDMSESGPFATDLLSGSRRTLSEVITLAEINLETGRMSGRLCTRSCGKPSESIYDVCICKSLSKDPELRSGLPLTIPTRLG